MKLENTRALLDLNPEAIDPQKLLVSVLRVSVELLSLDDNDYVWSYWRDQDEALKEVGHLLAVAEAGKMPELSRLSLLFAPTGPLQEVSMSSGWADAFLKVAERYDAAENGLYGQR